MTMQNWIRGMIKGMSFTTALFIFQCCYGMPQDMQDDLLLEGSVTSKTTGLPIEGIKVNVKETGQSQTTNSEGKFSLYAPWMESMTLQFQDVDGNENGFYADSDTVLTDLIPDSEPLTVDITLEEK